MTIKTLPKFYTLDPVTISNNKINFIEPNVSGTELTAEVIIGGRSHTNIVTEIQRALNETGTQDYTVTFDRVTRLYTITSTDIFSLLPVTGSNSTTSTLPLLGFTTDRVGLLTYESDTASGSEYIPTYFPQDFESFVNNKQSVSEKVNESADGANVEVVKFGSKQLMSVNIKWITNNLKSKDNFLRNNPTALEDARSYLDFATTRQEHEFMIDETVPATFDTVQLERTPQSRAGTGYKLTELLRDGLDEHYETGKLIYRKLI